MPSRKIWVCQYCHEGYDYEPVVCDNCHGAVFNFQEIQHFEN